MKALFLLAACFFSAPSAFAQAGFHVGDRAIFDNAIETSGMPVIHDDYTVELTDLAPDRKLYRFRSYFGTQAAPQGMDEKWYNDIGRIMNYMGYADDEVEYVLANCESKFHGTREVLATQVGNLNVCTAPANTAGWVISIARGIPFGIAKLVIIDPKRGTKNTHLIRRFQFGQQ